MYGLRSFAALFFATWVFIIIVTIFVFDPKPSFAFPTHLDKSKIKEGCSACHKGHGKSGSPMLKDKEETFCFKCHGRLHSGSDPSDVEAQDIYSTLLKQSSHPVLETSRYHFRRETLPESEPGVPRHVACADCHNTHFVEKTNMFKGVPGYTKRGGKVKTLRKENEYSLCYKCHSESENLPYGAQDISLRFDPVNSSFHPVETMGKGRYVPSLKGKFSTSSLITCSDCHGNDDEFGPKGPHGSMYAPILRHNYNRSIGAESITAYELCYECHDRTSIVNDDSFKAHKRHVVYGQISCNYCHDAHGSPLNNALIEFDEKVVFPTDTGQLNYFSFMAGKPKCMLVCHIEGQDYTHQDVSGQYCVNSLCPPGW